METFKENTMNFKSILFALTCSTMLISQFSHAVLYSPVQKQEKNWKYNFNYTKDNCRNAGYGAGVIKIGSEKYCAKRSEAKITNMKKTSNTTWSKTSSKTDWLFCNKNSSSCSQSLSTGKNSCVSTSTSVSKSISVTAGFEAELVKDVLSFGASSTASKSWTKTKGTNLCASSNLSQTCTVGAKKKVRLKHNLVMQHFKGDVTVYGWKMRREETKYFENGKLARTTYKDWTGYKSKSKKDKGAVEANFPIRRNAVCDAQKI